MGPLHIPVCRVPHQWKCEGNTYKQTRFGLEPGPMQPCPLEVSFLIEAFRNLLKFSVLPLDLGVYGLVKCCFMQNSSHT